MTKKELRNIIKSHERWLNGKNGERANLRGVDLSYTDLHGTNLRNADLRNANLCGINLSDADLNGANLSYAVLCNANLYYADLRNTALCHADLNNARLSFANLSNTDLRGANLRNANLCHVKLSGANLSGIVFNEGTAFYALQCPEEGSFIGYKKAHGYIVKLEILADAKRSSATSRKCRCSAAKVLSITTVDGSEEVKEIASGRDSNFIYRVGEIVRVDNFDEDRWNECSTGIHFFITRREAEQYGA